MKRERIVPSINHLLGALPRNIQQRMLKLCESEELPRGIVLCESGDLIRHVYFPTDGFIALAAIVGGGASVEVGLIGNEGMLGVPVALGVDTWPIRAIVRGAGRALRMSAAVFREELAQCSELRNHLGRYVYVLLAQLAQSAACTRFHLLEARVARCLLMTQDRAQTDHFHLTHVSLSEMLGVRRSGVTCAAGILQRKKLIQYARGEITVLDRKGLEQASCGCYGALTADYKRVLGNKAIAAERAA
jgi:CRP-like cAMP-binding protein